MKKQKSKVLVSERIVGSSMKPKTDPLSLRAKAKRVKSKIRDVKRGLSPIKTKAVNPKFAKVREAVGFKKSQGSKKSKNRKRDAGGSMDRNPTWRPFMM